MMIGIDNTNVMTERFPQVWQQLKQLQTTHPEQLNKVRVVDSKSKLPTLIVTQDGQEYYIHSKYDPMAEAQKFVAQFRNGKTYRHIFFYGIGLGYHVEMLLAQYPGVDFTLFEPAPEILYHYLVTRPLARLPLKSLKYLATEITPADTLLFLKNFTNLLQEDILFVTLPSYERIFKKHYLAFLQNFRKIVFYKRNALNTDLVYQSKWTLNSIKNFKYLLQTADFIAAAGSNLAGKPAIITAAGPSLMDEIENLRTIKTKGLAYIFSAGSALHPLLNHGILPDAAFVYDPNDNSGVYKPVLDKKIDTLPLIFGSTMGFSRFDEYLGPKFHFILSQDRVAQFFLQKPDRSELTVITDSTTISNIIFQLLDKLGCDPIIFVGQNLGYRGDLTYAPGISYYDPKLNEAKLKEAFLVEAVDGSQIYTTDTYRLMRENLEYYITRHSGAVYNATKGGAKIAGASFVTLEELIKSKLTQNIGSKNWLHQTQPSAYELSYLQRQQQRMKKSFLTVKGCLSKVEQLLERIQNLRRQNLVPALETAFKQLDQDLKRLTANYFYKVFIAPMLRVELDLLAKAIDRIQAERNQLTKADLIVKEFGAFIAKGRGALEKVSDPYLQQVDGVIRETLLQQKLQ